MPLDLPRLGYVQFTFHLFTLEYLNLHLAAFYFFFFFFLVSGKAFMKFRDLLRDLSLMLMKEKYFVPCHHGTSHVLLDGRVDLQLTENALSQELNKIALI